MDSHKISEEVVVDGWRYSIRHPDPEEAFLVGIELAKMIGEPVSKMALSGSGDKVLEALPSAISGFLKNLDPRQTLILFKRVLRHVEVQGKVDGENKKFMLDDAGFKIHFQGRSGAIIGLVAKAIEFQHADFFKAIKDGIAQMTTAL